MKSALIFEKDPASARSTAYLLASLGYVTASARTPAEMFNVASTLDFGVIVTCISALASDRRSLTGELKRIAPEAAVVLVCDERHSPSEANRHAAEGISGVLNRPFGETELRRIIEFGVDGCGLQPVYSPTSTGERRKRHAVFQDSAPPIE